MSKRKRLLGWLLTLVLWLVGLTFVSVGIGFWHIASHEATIFTKAAWAGGISLTIGLSALVHFMDAAVFLALKHRSNQHTHGDPDGESPQQPKPTHKHSATIDASMLKWYGGD